MTGPPTMRGTPAATVAGGAVPTRSRRTAGAIRAFSPSRPTTPGSPGPSASSSASSARSSMASGRRQAMPEWNRDMVEERVTQAALVLRRLPGLPRRGYFSTWPEIRRSLREIAQGQPAPMSCPLPSASAISRMEETITWNQYLERDEAHLMWGAPAACRGRSSATCSGSADRPRTGVTTTRSASSPGGSTAGRCTTDVGGGS